MAEFPKLISSISQLSKYIDVLCNPVSISIILTAFSASKIVDLRFAVMVCITAEITGVRNLKLLQKIPSKSVYFKTELLSN